MREVFHLIRFIWQMKGLFTGSQGHMEPTTGPANAVMIS